MPRHTHPEPARKHSRTHTRYQYDRYARRRWRQAKDRYGYRWDRLEHPEDLRARGEGYWPFSLSDNELAAYNPFTLCSCFSCSGWRQSEARRERRASERQWRADYEQQR